jgi:5-deoxy-glucuronate isomerase
MPQQYTPDNLIIHPSRSLESEVIVDVNPERAGWNTITFQARRLAAGSGWSFKTGDHELALVALGGSFNVESDRGRWKDVGGRPNVFAGLPHAIYLPRHTSLKVSSPAGCELAAALAPTNQDFPPRLVTPRDVWVEIRGGDHATRQINSILPPGFPCARLVVVEVYTPGGNWSSYPPHKHDVHRTGPLNEIVEADLDEIYYYRFDRREGYALQRIYSDPESPLRRAGYPIDATLMARENEVVLVPEGYHPVSAPPGYTAYYLNVLAGSAQSLAATDDPDFA